MKIPQWPEMGEESKVFMVELTEPEINALYGVIAFCRSAVASVPEYSPLAEYIRSWYEHYKTAIESVDRKLKEFDGL